MDPGSEHPSREESSGHNADAGNGAPSAEAPRGLQAGVKRFFTRRDKPYPAIREAGYVAVAILLGATLLWGLTGQSFPDRPIVVIESASMMRCEGALGQLRSGDECNEPFGRLGSITPGDLVFVRAVSGRGEVETAAANGGTHYGAAGDVIIYFPGGNAAETPIIHRAQFWLEIHEDGTFTVDELNLHRVSDLDATPAQAFGLPSNYDNALRDARAGPAHSGFITKGDNNPVADQGSSGAALYPVQESWVLGKARGEIPWVGLVNIGFRQFIGGPPWFTMAPTDTKVLLFACVALVIAAPWVVERIVRARRAKRRN